jgi:predicted RNA-binding protein YlqC (UPF0109 family)
MDETSRPLKSSGAGNYAIYGMLLYIVRSLVDHPENVQIAMITNPESTVFRVYGHPSDVTELMGRGGQTERALRLILGASGVKLGLRFTLEIIPQACKPQLEIH